MEWLNSSDIGALVFVLYSIFEYWIGKTDKTKANSLIELIGRFIISIIDKTKKGKLP